MLVKVSTLAKPGNIWLRSGHTTYSDIWQPVTNGHQLLMAPPNFALSICLSFGSNLRVLACLLISLLFTHYNDCIQELE